MQEKPHWRPCVTVPCQPPPSQRQFEEDLKWRPSQRPERVPEDPSARTWKAVSDQCRHSRVPGYTGFIPAARAEDVFGRTAAAVGEHSVYEQDRRERLRSTSAPGGGNTGAAGQRPSRPSSSGSGGGGGGGSMRAPLDLEHPLGRSQCFVQKGHWVPTIPGYSGYIPGKHAENICGGGIIHTCKMAGRAIAERSPLMDAPSQDAMSRQMPRSLQDGEPHPEQVRLASHIREHCERHIPGYSGHVPRVHSDSICGATFRHQNFLAADLAQDKIFNPERHIRDHCAPQAPGARRLRI